MNDNFDVNVSTAGNPLPAACSHQCKGVRLFNLMGTHLDQQQPAATQDSIFWSRAGHLILWRLFQSSSPATHRCSEQPPLHVAANQQSYRRKGVRVIAGSQPMITCQPSRSTTVCGAVRHALITFRVQSGDSSHSHASALHLLGWLGGTVAAGVRVRSLRGTLLIPRAHVMCWVAACPSTHWSFWPCLRGRCRTWHVPPSCAA